METALMVTVAVLAGAVLVMAIFVFRRQDRQSDIAPIQERLDSLNRQFGEVAGKSSTYQETLAKVHEALGGLGQTSQRILEAGREMKKLQEVLAAPTLRGGVGELMLEALLRQSLSKGSYAMQHTLRNGYRVDAAIKLEDGLVPVDAKFPLEDFRRLMDAEDGQRGTRMNRFRTAVKSHIDDIAGKYICPGETLDFALMYIPAENVYYEIILREGGGKDIIDYAWGKRVIPASPNSLYAYLQVIALGLRGLHVERNAKQMIEDLARLKANFDRFAEDFRLIGGHLGRAKLRYDESLPMLEGVRSSWPGQREVAGAIGQSDGKLGAEGEADAEASG